MSILTPVLWIDGVKTSLLNAILAAPKKDGSQNTYFAPDVQANRYGICVNSDVLPNGLATRFSIGTEDNEGVAIVTAPRSTDASVVEGEVNVKVATKAMTAKVFLHDLGQKDESGKALYTLRPNVHNQKARKVFTASEVFSVK